MTWSWRHEAACVDTPDLFFDRENVEAAKEICRTCPVRQPCLQEAMDFREPRGVWGGLTAPERRALRKQLGSTGCRSRRSRRFPPIPAVGVIPTENSVTTRHSAPVRELRRPDGGLP